MREMARNEGIQAHCSCALQRYSCGGRAIVPDYQSHVLYCRQLVIRLGKMLAMVTRKCRSMHRRLPLYNTLFMLLCLGYFCLLIQQQAESHFNCLRMRRRY
ncbi:uncharacterized protein LOC130999382 isoform X2 [Salvia miltiorrhiza]|uniref:uncharacterized protein LOC130999382 isoform X2 n=1 Tax=Salvia miltiorrhiza TaxID=226208 RepID=UPI0025AD696D|nr:uncharacterized protein LOC130999382 isoform X2 [Salvia miltiorrhiza]